MTAYGLSERFPPGPDCHNVGSLDPGAYFISPSIQPPQKNKVPFLSKAPRNIRMGNIIYTHAMYNAEKYHHIPGGSVMQSKCPRFQFHEEIAEDENICECNEQKCTCVEYPVKVGICQSEVARKMYKGRVPIGRQHSEVFLAHDRPAKGFPRFYDANVKESTQYYRGCKWSTWTGTRSTRPPENWPGPADYSIQLEPTPYQLCMEQYRFMKRHKARQLRYTEMIQLRDILQGAPGPADYDPRYPKCDIGHTGPKADRFPVSQYEKKPGPADYSIPGMTVKGARNVTPFGVTAKRLQYKYNTNPGPSDYSTNFTKLERDVHCDKSAPFGCSGERFPPLVYEESEYESDCPHEEADECPHPSWMFKSKTLRSKPLVKRLDWASPADYLLPKKKSLKRRELEQYLSPFHTSEARFRPWRNFIPVHASVASPGPCYYDLVYKPSCASTGISFSSAQRFPPSKENNPPPNAYTIDKGFHNLCGRFNARLAKSENDKLKWKPILVEPKSLRCREMALLLKSINDLDIRTDSEEIPEKKSKPTKKKIPKKQLDISKPRVPGEKLLLKYFLYDHQFPVY